MTDTTPEGRISTLEDQVAALAEVIDRRITRLESVTFPKPDTKPGPDDDEGMET